MFQFHRAFKRSFSDGPDLIILQNPGKQKQGMSSQSSQLFAADQTTRQQTYSEFSLFKPPNMATESSMARDISLLRMSLERETSKTRTIRILIKPQTAEYNVS